MQNIKMVSMFIFGAIRYILGDDLHVTYFNTGPVLLDFTRNTYKGRTALVALTLINEGEIQ